VGRGQAGAERRRGQGSGQGGGPAPAAEREAEEQRVFRGRRRGKKSKDWFGKLRKFRGLPVN
jgi:hypothetical protein